MGKKSLQLGDLVRLDGLEKPPEGVVTVELGGADVKSESVEQLGASMSDLAENLEDNKDVSVSAMVDLVKAMKNALTHELLPEITERLLKTLRRRFKNKDNMRMRHPGMEWAKVQEKLEKNPDKLWSLNEMEKTKGKPDVVGYENGEYIFMDCSAESPEGRRNCVYDKDAEEWLRLNRPTEKWSGNAVSMAVMMGVDILTEEQYRELQTKGEFDKSTWSWFDTPVDKRDAGVALYGFRNQDFVGENEFFAYYHDDFGAFRAALRV